MIFVMILRGATYQVSTIAFCTYWSANGTLQKI